MLQILSAIEIAHVEPLGRLKRIKNCNVCLSLYIAMFLMSSFIATSRLVNNSGYIQKLLLLSNSPEIL